MPPSIGKYTMKKKVPCRNFLWSESPSWRDWLSGPIWLSHVSAFVMHHLETEPYVNSACSNALEPHEIRLTFFTWRLLLRRGKPEGAVLPPFSLRNSCWLFFENLIRGYVSPNGIFPWLDFLNPSLWYSSTDLFCSLPAPAGLHGRFLILRNELVKVLSAVSALEV